jgi:zinc/manganese transport system ATP-binding protein
MDTPVIEFEDAALCLGQRQLWANLSLRIASGEFVAVMGANGSGKTTLMRVILGLQRLSRGRLRIGGRPPHRGSSDIGYVAQQRRIDPLTPLRAQDVVGQGLDGHRWGVGGFGSRRRARIYAALDAVAAGQFAQLPVGLLSGGEQQRVRIAQALVADPHLLLCDEPLLSLDLKSQSTVAALVERRRREHGTTVVFVTHEINPVLPFVDRVLYLAGGRFRIGSVHEVFTSASLSALYDAPIEVVRNGGRILVAGIPEADERAHEPGPSDLVGAS